MLAVNAEFSRKWPVIATMGEALDDAREWVDVPNKFMQHSSPKRGDISEAC